MDVRYSAEQLALRDAAAHLADRFGARTVESLADAERKAKLDAAISAAGWRELRGVASAVEAAIVTEELARGLADTPFIGPTLAAELRRITSAPTTTRRETVAVDGVVIDAQGCEAALAVLVDGALGEFLIETSHESVDLTRPAATVVHAEPTSALTIAEDDHTRWHALGLALTCADLVGVMRGATTLTTDYASVRRQYGVAVGSFQAVQHLLADALVATEGSASAALHAAWAVDALPAHDALVAGAAAKAYCSRAALTVCETAIQVHGGIGNTWDCLAHVYLRRALLDIELFGGVGPNLDRVLTHHGLR
jgi:alkylation response protein AidB-like acyl-CoA dehydrogenase